MRSIHNLTVHPSDRLGSWLQGRFDIIGIIVRYSGIGIALYFEKIAIDIWFENIIKTWRLC